MNRTDKCSSTIVLLPIFLGVYGVQLEVHVFLSTRQSLKLTSCLEANWPLELNGIPMFVFILFLSFIRWVQIKNYFNTLKKAI